MAAGAIPLRPTHPLLPLLLLLPFGLPSPPPLPAPQALLRLKQSFGDAAAAPLISWQPDTRPCDRRRRWLGLICYNDIVTGIRLGSMDLSGTVDVDSLASLPGLRTLNFINNSLSGSIPAFNRLTALKAVYLSDNRFSGAVPPDFFAGMGSLKKLWLSRNNLYGAIPPSISQVPNLRELHLDDNAFTGAIPDMEQPSLASLDLSNNRLMGRIPAALLKFNASSFQGNAGLCGDKVGRACGVPEQKHQTTPASPPSKPRGYSNDKLAATIMTVAAVIFSVMLVAIFVLRRKEERFDVLEKGACDESVEVHVSGSSRKESDPGSSAGFTLKAPSRGSRHSGAGGGGLVMVNGEKGVLRLSELMKSAAEAMGNGSLGSSYKAVMSSGVAVVVKRTKEMNAVGREGFDAEIRRLGRLNHRNVLTPLAYHHRKDEKLLIHEYIPKGSLLYLLHGDRGPSHTDLDWAVRLKIVYGIARGLGYLHAELSSSNLPHGNLKSSNVLLCTSYEPVLVDYGFSMLLTPTQAAQSLFAYKSPEAMQSHPVSPKCDVYCLGILTLEILSGKFPSQYLSHGQGGTDLVQWASSAISEGKEAEFFDPGILSSSSSQTFSEMERLLHVGAACTASKPEQRVGLREAIERIDEIRRDGTAANRLSKSGSRASSWREWNDELSGRRVNSFADDSS